MRIIPTSSVVRNRQNENHFLSTSGSTPLLLPDHLLILFVTMATIIYDTRVDVLIRTGDLI